VGFENIKFYPGKVFSENENGQINVQKTKKAKQCWQNTCFDCIIDFYGLVTKKIIFNL
jgi:hypothetical protein